MWFQPAPEHHQRFRLLYILSIHNIEHLKRINRYLLNFYDNFEESIKFLFTLTMFFPRPTTNPAKIVWTLTASHMITPTTFFDTRAASRAIFGVGRNIVRSFGIITTFFKPWFYDRTIRGKVKLQPTLKTAWIIATRALKYQAHLWLILIFQNF